ncbi:MAG: cupin-like domain-containing protein [Myxococcota bacterium]
MSTIPVLDQIEPREFFDDYCMRNRPCVLASGARHWPALERWRSDDYLRRKVGHRIVARTRSTRSDLGFDHISPISGVRFAEFLDSYQGDGRQYINDVAFPAVLISDIGGSPLLDGFAQLETRDRRIGMFMGSGQQFAPLHYDDEDNIYVVVCGEKRFTLFDIADFAGLYPHDDHDLPDFSRVPDPDQVDLDEFPAYAKVTRYDVRLGPGDMLYVPGYWWHSVRASGRSIALSYVRLDRRTQRLVFSKLLAAGVFPLCDAQRAEVTALLATPDQTARDVERELAAGRLEWDDLYSLYARLVTLASDTIARGRDQAALHAAFEQVVPEVRARLHAEIGRTSYPVLYLMNNFFRAGLGVFMSYLSRSEEQSR